MELLELFNVFMIFSPVRVLWLLNVKHHFLLGAICLVLPDRLELLELLELFIGTLSLKVDQLRNCLCIL